MNNWDVPIIKHVYIPKLGYEVEFHYTRRSALRFRLACLGWSDDQLDARVNDHIAKVQKKQRYKLDKHVSEPKRMLTP